MIAVNDACPTDEIRERLLGHLPWLIIGTATSDKTKLVKRAQLFAEYANAKAAWAAKAAEAVPEEELTDLLDSGATQCGACTPGVVMTAWWVLRNPHVTDTHSLRELMAGNLCRCTGYDGIIDGLEAWLGSGVAGARGPEGAS